jgi:hypothetical protein
VDWPCCLALRTPTLVLWIEIAKNGKFVIQGFIWSTKFRFQLPTLLQTKVAPQGEQTRVSAREGLAYHSVKLVLLANSNMYKVDSNSFLSEF